MQKSIFEELSQKLAGAYGSALVGDPLDPETLLGPLIDEEAVSTYLQAVTIACENGGELLSGGNRIDGPGFFVEPALLKADAGLEIVQEETFAPILYLIEVENLEEAVAIQNNVRQGLSSAIFTDSVRSAEYFLSALGSECGIANVNICLL